MALFYVTVSDALNWRAELGGRKEVEHAKKDGS